MKFTFYHKVLLILILFSGTYLYSVWQKKTIYNLAGSTELILKELPKYPLLNVKSGKQTDTWKEMSTSAKGLFVHFWGTWCAPCETELPSFLDFAGKLKEKNVQFVLLAVNDKKKDILKFMKRFKNLPENVIIALDEKGDAMSAFGSGRVPDTYLFDGNRQHLTKFVGPQAWELSQYLDRTVSLLELETK